MSFKIVASPAASKWGWPQIGRAIWNTLIGLWGKYMDAGMVPLGFPSRPGIPTPSAFVETDPFLQALDRPVFNIIIVGSGVAVSRWQFDTSLHPRWNIQYVDEKVFDLGKGVRLNLNEIDVLVVTARSSPGGRSRTNRTIQKLKQQGLTFDDRLHLALFVFDPSVSPLDDQVDALRDLVNRSFLEWADRQAKGLVGTFSELRKTPVPFKDFLVSCSVDAELNPVWVKPYAGNAPVKLGMMIDGEAWICTVDNPPMAKKMTLAVPSPDLTPFLLSQPQTIDLVFSHLESTIPAAPEIENSRVIEVLEKIARRVAEAAGVTPITTLKEDWATPGPQVMVQWRHDDLVKLLAARIAVHPV